MKLYLGGKYISIYTLRVKSHPPFPSTKNLPNVTILNHLKQKIAEKDLGSHFKKFGGILKLGLLRGIDEDEIYREVFLHDNPNPSTFFLSVVSLRLNDRLWNVRFRPVNYGPKANPWIYSLLTKYLTSGRISGMRPKNLLTISNFFFLFSQISGLHLDIRDVHPEINKNPVIVPRHGFFWSSQTRSNNKEVDATDFHVITDMHGMHENVPNA